MRATLPNDYACNWRATFGARLAGTLVNAEIILKIPPTVDPVNAGTITGNPVFKDSADAGKQHPGLFFGEAIGRGEWVQTGQVQGFIRIDIPQACQEGLVEQKGLELAVGTLQSIKQVMGGKSFVQGFRAQAIQHAVHFIHQPDAAELTGIIEGQLEIPLELEQEAVVGGRKGASRPDQQVTAHAQVKEQPIVRESEHQELAPPASILYHLAHQALAKFVRAGLGQGARPQQVSLQDMPSDHGWLSGNALAQVASNGFNFG